MSLQVIIESRKEGEKERSTVVELIAALLREKGFDVRVKDEPEIYLLNCFNNQVYISGREMPYGDGHIDDPLNSEEEFAKVVKVFAVIDATKAEAIGGGVGDGVGFAVCPLCGKKARFGWASSNGHRWWKCPCLDVQE